MYLAFIRFFFIGLLCINTAYAELPSKNTSPQKKPKLVLITGCGRSGTDYMTKFLQKCGLYIGHEWMGGQGSVSWLMAADTDWAPWGPLYKDFMFVHVFHQVRNPIKVIQSYYNHPPGTTWEWICHVIPKIKLTDSTLTKCAKYWYYWNLMAEKKAEWTYKIEDFDTAYKIMAKKLNKQLSKKILNSIPKNTHTRGFPLRPISWKILKKELDPQLFAKIRRLAIHYGYNPVD